MPSVSWVIELALNGTAVTGGTNGPAVFTAQRDGAFKASVVTDDMGQYRFVNIPSGNYLVMAEVQRSVTYYPGVVSPSDAIPVPAERGDDTSSYSFPLVLLRSAIVPAATEKFAPPD